MFSSLGTAVLIYEAGLFFIVDQYDVRPIVRQTFVGLDREVPENLGMIVPNYSFWFYPPAFTQHI